MDFFSAHSVLNKDYKKWVLGESSKLVQAVNQQALRLTGKPIIHLASSALRKGPNIN